MENRLLLAGKDSIKNGAIIVGLQTSTELSDLRLVEEDLTELSALLRTLKIPTLFKIIHKKIKLSSSHLLGLGKLEEIKELIEQSKAELVVIDHDLSGVQMRNLEKMLEVSVLDRAAVILEIFAMHAKTSSAKTQVEIAQLEYLLPRLTGAWTHLGRQAGGVNSRGMGEKQIEIDRRRARERIVKLKAKLEDIQTEKQVQRKSRQNELKVSLVGYTNSGKTTLMKCLTKSSIQAKDELFATLDAHTKIIDPSSRPKILLSDTVGFIRKLPESLMESFKSTLDEVLSSDLLLIVVDASSNWYESQLSTTVEVLDKIGASDLATIFVFNKTDALEEKFLLKILNKKYPGSIAISAHNLEEIKKLRALIFKFFEKNFVKTHVKIPILESLVLSRIHQNCTIIDSSYEDPGFVEFHLSGPASIINSLKPFRAGS